jgi:hypothetical protein
MPLAWRRDEKLLLTTNFCLGPGWAGEMHDLSAQFPDKLRELAVRLSSIQRTAFQTWNYTAQCDACQTVEAVAAEHRGFVAPPCACTSREGMPAQ